jgi:hypothetical protein
LNIPLYLAVRSSPLTVAPTISIISDKRTCGFGAISFVRFAPSIWDEMNFDVFKSLVSNTKVLKIFAFSNNHYGGYGPATAKLFMDLWNRDK